MSGLFFAQVERYGNDVFLRAKMDKGVPADRWVATSWIDAAVEVENFGAGLVEMGVAPGDKIAIFAHNQPRWIIADQAIQAAGAVGVPVYPTSTDRQLDFILRDSGAKAVVAGDEKLLEQALRVAESINGIERVIATFPAPGAGEGRIESFERVMEAGAGSNSARAELDRRRAALSPDDPAAVIYTSGTTGEPKGAVLTQSNFMAQNEALLDAPLTRRMVERDIRLTSLCHLPLCHIYGRTSDYHVLMCMGGEVWFAESIAKVPENLLEVRPQMLVTIPRLYEKVYDAVNKKARRLAGRDRKIFDWSIRVGNKVVDCLANGRRLPPHLSIMFALAGTLVYNRVRKESGLDRLVFSGSGGGALSAQINRFFRSMNIQVGEGYGLTETASAVAWNTLDYIEPPPDNVFYKVALDYLIDCMVVMQSKGINPFSRPLGILKMTYASNLILPKLIQKPGTVGRPCKDTEIRLADDGEIEVKGPQVFKRELGYLNRPDLTDEVFTDDGFFITGDIGAFDEDGYLSITDRKKEILVTAGGKNVAPHPIELALALDPMIEQACVIGDEKKYLSALLVPSFDSLEIWAREKGVQVENREELIENQKVIDMVSERVEKVNRNLARYEQIKKFCLLPVEFSEETGELTPTQKMKRRVIADKFKEEIDSCYLARAEKN